MLQFRRHFTGKNVVNLFKRFSTVISDNKEIEPETNFVKLIGSAWDNSTALPDGAQTCKVVQRCRTENQEQFSISHVLVIQPKVQLSCDVYSLARGQRFNVNGYIRSIEFKTGRGMKRRAIAIVPNEIKTYKTDEEQPSEDVCIVMMTAYIESPIYERKNATMFNLRTHVLIRNEEQEFTGEDKQHTHSIVVNDSELRNFTRNNLAQYDRVFIEGYLNYNKSDTEDGGTRVCGNIVAVHIEKILDS